MTKTPMITMTYLATDSSTSTGLISEREKEVLMLVAHELTSQEIAKKLYISNHTAISHRKHLLEKFGVRNTAGLVRRAFEVGLLSVSQGQY